MNFRICDDKLHPTSAFEAARDPACGAVASFVGTVRGTNDGKRVLRLEYEVHESMALAQFERLAAHLKEAHGVERVAIHHRRGAVEVGGVSVVIVVASPRRGPALAACAEAIEKLKSDVPIWKKEIYPDGHRWMEGS
ncbi:MAG: molybdenum cofactor biosynthesis protein MoaE [Planctomycetota bacterium]